MNTKKTCSLDPLPTSVLQPCFQSLAPAYSHINNMSLSQGKVPASLKETIVMPHSLSPCRAMHCLSQYMTASNRHFRMVLFFSTFAAFFVSNRVDTVDVGCSTAWVNFSACCRDFWWYWVSSCSLHFSVLLCQAVKGRFTN